MSVNSAAVRFEWNHEKNKSSEDDLKKIMKALKRMKGPLPWRKMPTWSQMTIATLGELTAKEIVQCGS